MQFQDLQSEHIFFGRATKFLVMKNWYKKVLSVFDFVCFSGCHFTIGGFTYKMVEKISFYLKNHLFTYILNIYIKGLLLVHFFTVSLVFLHCGQKNARYFPCFSAHKNYTFLGKNQKKNNFNCNRYKKQCLST